MWSICRSRPFELADTILCVQNYCRAAVENQDLVSDQTRIQHQFGLHKNSQK